ncbi:MAG: transposase [Chloroflexi bacterium]|nr:transposase [Chloroflexota bacterium]
MGAIIGNFKSTTARRINLLRNTAGASVWQRGYHDHIIRNEREGEAVRAYIAANPSRWALDIDNPIHSLKSAPRRTVDDYLRDAYLL